MCEPANALANCFPLICLPVHSTAISLVHAHGPPTKLVAAAWLTHGNHPKKWPSFAADWVVGLGIASLMACRSQGSAHGLFAASLPPNYHGNSQVQLARRWNTVPAPGCHGCSLSVSSISALAGYPAAAFGVPQKGQGKTYTEHNFAGFRVPSHAYCCGARGRSVRPAIMRLNLGIPTNHHTHVHTQETGQFPSRDKLSPTHNGSRHAHLQPSVVATNIPGNVASLQL